MREFSFWKWLFWTQKRDADKGDQIIGTECERNVNGMEKTFIEFIKMCFNNLIYTHDLIISNSLRGLEREQTEEF